MGAWKDREKRRAWWRANSERICAERREKWRNDETFRHSMLASHKAYSRTVSGWITKTLDHMSYGSRVRRHDFDREHAMGFVREFVESEAFAKLWDAWVASGHDKAMRPSIDRLDNDVGYVRSNVRLVTWQQNIEAYWKSEKNRAHILRLQKRSAKLTEDDVRTIRKLVEHGMTSREISGRYGVNPATINMIKRRATWAHVE